MATLDRDDTDEAGVPPILATAPVPQADAAERPSRHRRVRLRLALPALAVAALVVVGLVGVGLGYWPGSGPHIAPVTLGYDGIPNQIDGQRVYRTADQAEWQSLSGSFLLGGWPECGQPGCFGNVYFLAPMPSDKTGAAEAGGPDLLVDQGSEALVPWGDNPVVALVRAQEEPACDSWLQYSCGLPEVAVEQVVWPAVPDEIDSQHVYRAADSAAYDKLKGSFLFGGFASGPQLDPECGPAAWPTAQALLLPDCMDTPFIDGVSIAPASKVDPAASQVVVVRVHVNDALAAGCSADIRSQCEQAMVVDSVVWSYDPYAPPYVIVTTTPAVVTPSVGPLEPDGLPTTIGGQQVYSGSNLSTGSTFLLGGRLTQDASCPSGQAAPAPNSTATPACYSWKVGGVPVRAVTGIPENLIGRLVVVQVVRSKSSDCTATASTCSPQAVLVVTGISWSGS